ncbi:fumarylacetoacetate hydrolase family protein [Citricoccus sp. NPDC055426]|uniref:fumarylacetoacetate hydrolase family protein n=1 Tax=Citricoccus sp. NPDC055426 TaxID=3155536 RepID=UPI003438F3EB
MKLSTIRFNGETYAARQEGEEHVVLDGFSDVGALLQHPEWADIATSRGGTRLPSTAVELAPVIPRPGKIICVGANYQTHIEEMGADVPEYPTLFAKYPEALIGASDPIDLPVEDELIDWEAELAIVVGTAGRRIPVDAAAAHIAGYSVANDISMRGYQFRTMQWLQGKTWENSTPLGPVMVTPEEMPPAAMIRTVLDGDVMQESSIDDLLFSPEQLVSYISTILTLNVGDVILTGTPSGVGFGMNPQRFIKEGSVVETSIEGIGVLRNRAQRQPAVTDSTAQSHSMV